MFVLALVLLMSTAGADTITVPDDYTTIQAAVDAAQDGDTIVVKAGGYTESVDVSTTVSIVGAGDTTVVTAVGSFGIKVMADGTDVSALKVTGATSAGILLNAAHCSVEGVTSTGNVRGITLQGATQSYVGNSTLDGNTYAGLALYGTSTDNWFYNNSVDSCGNFGLDVFTQSGDNLFEACTFDNAAGTGALINGYANGNTIKDCTANNAAQNGISLFRADDTRIDNCTVTVCTQRGISIGTETQGTWVTNCTITDSAQQGIYVDGEVDGRFEDNTVADNGDHGIEILNARQCLFSGNTLTDNAQYGLRADQADACRFVNNTVTGNGIGLYLWYGDAWEIGFNEISDNDDNGMQLANSGTDGGSWIHNNTVLRNALVPQAVSAGIFFWGSFSKKNIVEDNTVVGNWVGIGFRAGGITGHVVRRNLVKDSPAIGIQNTHSAGPNTFYHNNLVNNTEQVSAPHASDVFDDGAMGNYWSDYTAKYPSATRTGKVWDTPYEVAGTTVLDNYPLALMFDDESPVADAGEDLRVPMNAQFTLDGSGSTDDLGVVNHTWTYTPPGQVNPVELYGDTVQLAFGEPAIVTFQLTVSDEWGNTGTDSVDVEVYDDVPPMAMAGPDIWVNMSEEFTLDASMSDDNVGIVVFSWAIDPDGLNLTHEGVTFTTSIDLPGQYIADLNVTDEEGNWAMDSLVITVRDSEPPVADAGEDITVDEDVMVTFNGTASTDNVGIVVYNWSFMYRGVLSMVFGAEATFTFEDPGVYEVTLNVTDAAANWAHDTMTVTVNDTTAPEAMAGYDASLSYGETAELNGSGSSDNVGIVNWTWEFEEAGEGVTLYGEVVAHTFGVTGTFTVKLTVADAAGNTANDTVEVVVRDLEPPVPVAGENQLVDSGTTVTMDGSGSYDDVGITSWTWTFEYDGEERTLDGETAEFTFVVPGEYLISLNVTDAAGNFNMTGFAVTVQDVEAPMAAAGDDQTVDEGTAVSFDGSGSSDDVEVTGWYWTFSYGGDDKNLSGETANFLFDEAGTYTVTLEVVDGAGNSGTDTLTVTVTANEIQWMLGPFLDGDGNPLAGVSVEVDFGTKIKSGTTDGDGNVEMRVLRADMSDTASVKATKDGYKGVEFVVDIGDDWQPEGAIPRMVKEDEDGGGIGGLAIGIIVLVVIIVILVVVLLMRRGGGPAPTTYDEGDEDLEAADPAAPPRKLPGPYPEE